MPSRSLPTRPNLKQLKLQANELLRTYREGSLSAASRIVAHHPPGDLGPLPKNIVEVARLVFDAGADVSATTLGPNGGTTLDAGRPPVPNPWTTASGTRQTRQSLLSALGRELRYKCRSA